ncbi:tubulin binding cofactor C-domain-containing protein [Peziza echinospora]|nr:tubulin binding cofactor C-domain-containing protein [Peziza echinospora]
MDPTPEDDSTIIQAFYTWFHQEASTLEALIANLKTLPTPTIPVAIDQYLARINHISNRVKAASNYLPAYDQRKYAEQVRALSEQLTYTKKAVQPKQKFSFKSRGTTSGTPTTTSSASSSSATSRTSTPLTTTTTTTKIDTRKIHPTTFTAPAPPPPPQPQTNSESPAQESHHLTLKDLSYTHHPISALTAPTPLHLTNLENTILTLPPPPPTSSSQAPQPHQPSVLALNNAKNSIIFLPHITGPAHLTSLENVLLVISCKQFRMHKSSNVKIYLRCPSRPIIEDCKDIEFAPLEAWRGGSSEDGGVGTGEDGRNLWDQVDDFKWLRMEKSPNWRVLDVEERVDVNELWRVVGGAGGDEGKRFEGKELEEVLARFLPVGLDGEGGEI